MFANIRYLKLHGRIVAVGKQTFMDIPEKDLANK